MGDNIEIDCPHNDKYLRVVESCVNCETTVLVCKSCGQILSEPKIECI